MARVASVVAAEFTVKFDGPALDEHEMDVATLAPALLALSDGVKVAHSLTGGAGSDPALKIQATREGSFEIALVVEALTDSTVQGVVATTGVSAVGAITGAFHAIKWLRNRRPQTVAADPDASGGIVYTMADGSSLSVPATWQGLIESSEFRVVADQFTRPLELDGVDSVDILPAGDARPVRIASEDRDAFVFSEDQPLIGDYERVGILTVSTIQLDDGLLWRFHEQDQKFTARVEDADFLARVRLGRETISYRDKLHVTLREQVYRRSNLSPRLVRTVLHVDRIERAPQQGEIDFDQRDREDQVWHESNEND